MTLFKTLRDFLGLKFEEKCFCMLVTEQEGAGIFLEGKDTGFTTPKMLRFSKNKVMNVEFHLPGHEIYQAQVKAAHNLSYYYCTMDRIPLRLVSNEIYSSAAR